MKPKQPSIFQTKREDPPLHLCHCGKWGSFGLGPPIHPNPGVWFCREHLPADYWSRK